MNDYIAKAVSGAIDRVVAECGRHDLACIFNLFRFFKVTHA
jgi:hypothetical protein